MICMCCKLYSKAKTRSDDADVKEITLNFHQSTTASVPSKFNDGIKWQPRPQTQLATTASTSSVKNSPMSKTPMSLDVPNTHMTSIPLQSSSNESHTPETN